MNLNELAKEIHKTAVERGQWNGGMLQAKLDLFEEMSDFDISKLDGMELTIKIPKECISNKMVLNGNISNNKDISFDLNNFQIDHYSYNNNPK